MNRRLLYVFLIVQGLFAVALIYVGTRAREGRRQDYLELTHRITAGHATPDDFEKLKFMLPIDADADRVRSFLGLPIQTASSVELASEKGKSHAGKFWIYYPQDASQQSIDREAAEKLSGSVRCFVVEFGEKGTRADVVDVVHPIAK